MSYLPSEVSTSRVRKLTDKGRHYQIGILQDKRRNLEVLIKSQISELEKFVKSEENKSMFIQKFEELNTHFETFMKIHGQCQILIGQEDREEDDYKVDFVDRKMYGLRRSVRSWLSQKKRSRQSLRVLARCLKHEVKAALDLDRQQHQSNSK